MIGEVEFSYRERDAPTSTKGLNEMLRTPTRPVKPTVELPLKLLLLNTRVETPQIRSGALFVGLRSQRSSRPKPKVLRG